MVGAGAVTALTYSQSINTLPVSLFAMATSAAEQSAMSSALGDPARVATQLQVRLDSGLWRIAFWVAPFLQGLLQARGTADGPAPGVVCRERSPASLFESVFDRRRGDVVRLGF
jgi:hypothetical protein